MAENSKAAQLKEEGNKFFVQQEHSAAYAKYTEAIAEDATNAVLYANRAACSLAMKRQASEKKIIDAMTDLVALLVTKRLPTMRKRSIYQPNKS